MSTIIAPEHVDQRQVMVAALDILCRHVIERAGRKLARRNRSCHGADLQAIHCRPDVEVCRSDVPKMIVDCWDGVPGVVDVYGCCGMDADRLVETLDGYIADLLTTSRRHTIPGMLTALSVADPQTWGDL